MINNKNFLEDLSNINIYMRFIFLNHNSIKNKEEFNKFLFRFFDAFHNINNQESFKRDLSYFLEEYFINWKLKEVLWDDESLINSIRNLETHIENLINN